MDWMQAGRMKREVTIIAPLFIVGLMIGVGLTLSFFVSAQSTSEIFCRIDKRFEEIDGVLRPIFFPDTNCTQAPQCSDGIDNDGDGLTDLSDPGCSSASDTDETDPVAPPPPPPPPPPPATACADGVDNDGDGKVDLADPGCSDASDTDETDGATPPPPPPPPPPPTGGGSGTPAACADGVDNDGDGKVDLADPGCSHSGDTDETDPPQGGGGVISGPLSVGSGSSIPVQPTILGVSIEDCNTYLSGFIKPGADNDRMQVERLQLFLNQFEGTTLSASGIYDAATIAAVDVFQLKYASDILTPWGITNATSHVYLTTRKKVNELYCKGIEAFPLTENETQEIEKYREEHAYTETSSTPALLSLPPVSQVDEEGNGEEGGENSTSSSSVSATGEDVDVPSRSILRSILQDVRGVWDWFF